MECKRKRTSRRPGSEGGRRLSSSGEVRFGKSALSQGCPGTVGQYLNSCLGKHWLGLPPEHRGHLPEHRDEGQPSFYSPHPAAVFGPPLGSSLSFELPAPYRSACLSPQPGKPSFFLASVNVSGGLCAELDLTHLMAFPPGKFTPTSPCSAPGQCLGAKLLCTRAALSRAARLPCRVELPEGSGEGARLLSVWPPEHPVLLSSLHVCETERGVAGRALNWASGHLVPGPALLES